MLPQTPRRKPRNSARANLLISVVFHAGIVLLLVFFAAREGLLGTQLKKITVQMVKEKPPEKPKEPEKPKVEPPKIEPPKIADLRPATPKLESPKTAAVALRAPVAAAPAAAPPAVDVPSFQFDGGKTVQTTSDPIQLYNSAVESVLRSHWHRPTDMVDDKFVVEVEVSIDGEGRVSDPLWKRGSGDARWDASVREAITATPVVDRPPPKNFPGRILVRFDLQDTVEPIGISE